MLQLHFLRANAGYLSLESPRTLTNRNRKVQKSKMHSVVSRKEDGPHPYFFIPKKEQRNSIDPLPYFYTHKVVRSDRGDHGPGDPSGPLSPTRKFYLFGSNFFDSNIKQIFFKSLFNKWAGLGP